jgi:hypothetical protein
MGDGRWSQQGLLLLRTARRKACASSAPPHRGSAERRSCPGRDRQNGPSILAAPTHGGTIGRTSSGPPRLRRGTRLADCACSGFRVRQCLHQLHRCCRHPAAQRRDRAAPDRPAGPSRPRSARACGAMVEGTAPRRRKSGLPGGRSTLATERRHDAPRVALPAVAGLIQARDRGPPVPARRPARQHRRRAWAKPWLPGWPPPRAAEPSIGISAIRPRRLGASRPGRALSERMPRGIRMACRGIRPTAISDRTVDRLEARWGVPSSAQGPSGIAVATAPRHGHRSPNPPARERE